MRSLEMAGAAGLSARIKPGGLMAAVALIACRSLADSHSAAGWSACQIGDAGVALGARPKIHSMSSSDAKTQCVEDRHENHRRPRAVRFS